MPSSIEATKLRAQLRRLGGNNLRTANTRAVNRATTTVRKELVTTIRKTLNVKAGVVRGRIQKTRATRGRPAASLRFSGERLSLIEFAPRQTRKGVSFRTRGRRRLIPGAFITTAGRSEEGVYLRRRVGGRRAGRLPIRKLLGDSVAYPVRPRKTLKRAFKTYRRRYIEVLRQELKFRRGRGR